MAARIGRSIQSGDISIIYEADAPIAAVVPLARFRQNLEEGIAALGTLRKCGSRRGDGHCAHCDALLDRLKSEVAALLQRLTAPAEPERQK